MANKKLSLIVVVCCLAACLYVFGGGRAFFSCSRQLSIPEILRSGKLNRVNPPEMPSEVVITPWFVLGPFPFKEQEGAGDGSPMDRRGLDYDFLAEAGHPEAQLTPEGLASLCSTAKRCRMQTPHGAVVNLDALFGSLTYSVVYAATVITSDRDGVIFLEFDHNAGGKIWLNGKMISELPSQGRRPAFKYVRFQALHLKRGPNTLLVKVDQKEAGPAYEPWTLFASLMTIPKMRDVWLANQDGWLLRDMLLKRGEPLHVSMLGDKDDVLERNVPIQLSITDWSGAVVMSRTIYPSGNDEVPIPELADGAYTLTEQIGPRMLRDRFYIGDPGPLLDELGRVQRATAPASQEYLQRDPIIQRYRILTSPKYARPTDPNWQKKLALVLHEATRSIHNPKEAAWCRMPGPHLRSFVSKVDGTHQFYLLHIPRTTQGPFPIVMVMPVAVTIQRPFLESALISAAGTIEEGQRAADLSGSVVTVINGRGTVGASPLGEADAFEVLNDINSSYPIDPSRLYLYGACEGGRRAILLAEHYPGVFAAIAAYGPTVTAYEGAYVGKHTDPFALADQLASTAVLLTKGEWDDLSPTSDLQSFQERLKAAGSPAVLEIVQDGMHDSNSAQVALFPRLARHRKMRVSASIADLTKAAIQRTRP